MPESAAALPKPSLEALHWLGLLGVKQAQGLCAEALTHASAGSPHYERLEYLGDAVLKLEASRWLYAQSPSLSEGAMTKARAWLVSDATLAQVSSSLGLPALLKVGVGQKGLRQAPSVQASALEALMGALYVLHGPQAAQEALGAWLGPWLTRCVAAASVANPKEELQEWTQAQGQGLPNYLTQPHEAGGFQAEACLGGRVWGQGVGPTKKAAEQVAARAALDALRAEAKTKAKA